MKLFLMTCSLAFLLWTSQTAALSADLEAGKALFMLHCSPCHGEDARGNGSVSHYLSAKVPDLTLIKNKNNGVYPLDEVISVIDGRRIVRAHGEREMPVWGEIFKREQKQYPDGTGLMKAKIIAEYIATLQR